MSECRIEICLLIISRKSTPTGITLWRWWLTIHSFSFTFYVHCCYCLQYAFVIIILPLLYSLMFSRRKFFFFFKSDHRYTHFHVFKPNDGFHLDSSVLFVSIFFSFVVCFLFIITHYMTYVNRIIRNQCLISWSWKHFNTIYLLPDKQTIVHS